MSRDPQPNLDERFSLPEDTDPDDVLCRLLGVEGDEVSNELDEDESED